MTLDLILRTRCFIENKANAAGLAFIASAYACTPIIEDAPHLFLRIGAGIVAFDCVVFGVLALSHQRFGGVTYSAYKKAQEALETNTLDVVRPRLEKEYCTQVGLDMALRDYYCTHEKINQTT